MLLQRYIIKTVITATLLVLVVLLGLQVFIALMAEAGDIGDGEYGILQAIIYVCLKLPQNLYLIFPLAGLIGSLLGLGILANNSELTIMRASGMSSWKITGSVMLAAIVMMVAVTIIGEWIAPLSDHYAELRKSAEQSGGQVLMTRQGVWLREGNNFIHIAQILPGDRLSGISRYEFNDKHQLIRASQAKTAYYKQKYWVVNDVATSVLTKTQVTNQFAPQQHWQLSLRPELLNVTNIKPKEMNLLRLYEYMAYRHKNGLHPNQYNLAFWQRVYRPLSILVMMFLAIPFIFGSLRNATMGLRILTGIMVGFSFYILEQLGASLSLLYQLPLGIVTLTPTIIFILPAVWLLRRVR